MPTYAYQVRDKEGRKVRGKIEAPSEKNVVDRLLEEGFLITQVKPANRLALSGDLLSMGAKISSDDFTMFYFQLGNMVEAGIPLLTALQTVVNQIANVTLKKVVQNLISKVENGASFSEAMGHHTKMFPLLYRSMIRVGETSGTLAETLRHVGELNEARAELQHQVRSALAYPMVLIVASIAVVILMMVWIVPTFTTIFNKAGIPLPLPTRLIFGFSVWVKANPWVLAGILAGGIIGGRSLIHLPSVKYQWDRFWLSVPAVGLLMRRIEVARWSRSVALMLSSGVPILQALEIAQNLTQNLVFREVLANAYTDIQRGGKLADTLQKGGAFPNDVVQMVSAGENSGTLDKMLYKVANFYDQLIARTLKKVTAMIEPISILFMGGIVAFIMLSILLPIFDMIKIFSAH